VALGTLVSPILADTPMITLAIALVLLASFPPWSAP
jgi:hypothetical protein